MENLPKPPKSNKPDPGYLLSSLIILSRIASLPVNLLIKDRDPRNQDVATIRQQPGNRDLSDDDIRYIHYTDRQRKVEALILTFCALPWVSQFLHLRYSSPILDGVLLAINLFIIINTFFVSFAYVVPHTAGRASRFIDLSRALLINIVSFCANIFAFGYVYTLLDIHAPQETPHWIDPFYFSVKSALTVGYGDLTPHGPLAKAVTMAQSIMSFIFSLVILGRIISSVPPVPSYLGRDIQD